MTKITKESVIGCLEGDDTDNIVWCGECEHEYAAPECENVRAKYSSRLIRIEG